jgi:CDP-diacylglycerol--glycerol-3-phosphate 3-phosphatidyltransferase
MKKEAQIETLYELFTKSKRITLIINLITLYRIAAAPVIMIFLFTDKDNLFKWFLLFSFLTDMVDGFLARHYNANTIIGAKLDSIGDDFTILVALIGLFKLRYEFVTEHTFLFIFILVLFVIQLVFSLYKYGKISSFHTYTAKISALLQGLFLLSIFFFKEPILLLFYIASILTIIDLIEEIILVYKLPKWENDVKGLFWVLKKNKL